MPCAMSPACARVEPRLLYARTKPGFSSMARRNSRCRIGRASSSEGMRRRASCARQRNSGSRFSRTLEQGDCLIGLAALLQRDGPFQFARALRLCRPARRPGPRQTDRSASKLDLGPQLDRSRLVTLQRHQAELGRTPVRVGIAEYDPVGDVASLRLQAPAEAVRRIASL